MIFHIEIVFNFWVSWNRREHFSTSRRHLFPVTSQWPVLCHLYAWLRVWSDCCNFFTFAFQSWTVAEAEIFLPVPLKFVTTLTCKICVVTCAAVYLYQPEYSECRCWFCFRSKHARLLKANILNMLSYCKLICIDKVSTLNCISAGFYCKWYLNTYKLSNIAAFCAVECSNCTECVVTDLRRGDRSYSSFICGSFLNAEVKESLK